ncbi:STAS domain-containing protein [Mesobacillus maritimus]|uniref:STAS domain-containing protein n=1 Tax=Mesobacillus maritimus TaxID=1643336 RepID=UPI003850538B
MEKKSKEMKSMQETIDQLTKRVNELESIIEQAALPIIPSIVPNTLLIPFTGVLSSERFQMIIPKVLNDASGTTDSVILDFTAISISNVKDLQDLGKYLKDLMAALNLMGIEVHVVGFSPQLAQVMVKSRLSLVKEVNAFSNFKSALEFLLKKKGLALTEVSSVV